MKHALHSELAPLAEEGDNRVSRFDRYKAYYKGHYNEVDEESVDFTYDDFASVLADTEYGFKIDEIVTGTVVKFDGEKRALIEIGAKSAAVLPSREISINELEEGEKLSDKRSTNEVARVTGRGTMATLSLFAPRSLPMNATAARPAAAWLRIVQIGR